MNELGETISTGENRINPLAFFPIPQNIWSKGPEDIYF